MAPTPKPKALELADQLERISEAEPVVTPSSRAADLICELAERWAESPTLRADPGLRFKPMFIGTITDGDHS